MNCRTVAGQQLWHGDCCDLFELLPAGSIDVVVTSPPYNLGTPYGAYRDRLPRQAYLNWLMTVFMGVEDALAPDGSFFLNVGGTAKDPWLPGEVAEVAGELFTLQNSIVWVKSAYIGGRTHGHFKPVNSPRFLTQCWEMVYHFTKQGGVPIDRLALGVPYEDPSNIGRFPGAAAGRRCRGNVWFVPYATVSSRDEKGRHPAVFPVELAENCLALHGVVPGMRVLDPFVGSGSSLVACLNQGAAGIGVDLDQEYLTFATARLEREALRLSIRPPRMGGAADRHVSLPRVSRHGGRRVPAPPSGGR